MQEPQAGGIGLVRRHPSPKSPKRFFKSGGGASDESEKSPSVKSAFRLPRSRIGTETSVETAFENVAAASSFEDELFRQAGHIYLAVQCDDQNAV